MILQKYRFSSKYIYTFKCIVQLIKKHPKFRYLNKYSVGYLVFLTRKNDYHIIVLRNSFNIFRFFVGMNVYHCFFSQNEEKVNVLKT